MLVLKNSDEKIVFGYISGKSGYYINSLKKSNGLFVFTVTTEQHNGPQLAWEEFKNGISNFNDKFSTFFLAI